MKKIPFKIVSQMFKDEGYEVLTKKAEYEGIWKTKIKYICLRGHRGSMPGSSFRKGHRCIMCTYIPFIDIIKSFHNKGYTVLTKESEYKNTRKTKIQYKCPNNHIHTIAWNNWIHGQGCPQCKRISYKKLKKSFENEGYKLLTEKKDITEVISKLYLQYQCPNNHIHAIKWNNWYSQKQRCPFCAKIKYEDIKNSLENEGYKLLTKVTYNFTFNSNESIIFKCPNNHIHSTTPYRWSKIGSRCPHCKT